MFKYLKEIAINVETKFKEEHMFLRRGFTGFWGIITFVMLTFSFNGVLPSENAQSLINIVTFREIYNNYLEFLKNSYHLHVLLIIYFIFIFITSKIIITGKCNLKIFKNRKLSDILKFNLLLGAILLIPYFFELVFISLTVEWLLFFIWFVVSSEIIKLFQNVNEKFNKACECKEDNERRYL